MEQFLDIKQPLEIFAFDLNPLPNLKMKLISKDVSFQFEKLLKLIQPILATIIVLLLGRISITSILFVGFGLVSYFIYMSYNNEEFPQYVRTAGKITIATAIMGIFVFLAAFMVDFGSQELQKVSAQQATTTLTVLNTPPEFTVEPYETVESSVTNPTNSGDEVRWEAVGTDSNGAPYFLLV
mgnify:CR=1 FL=1